jgi:hypothetical protein
LLELNTNPVEVEKSLHCSIGVGWNFSGDI